MRLAEDFSALESRVKLGIADAAGLLRVAVAPVFGRLYIVPHLTALLDRYPALRVELISSERRVNLVEENIDIAIRHGELQDSSLASRHLAYSPLVTVASPGYFARHNEPRHPSELAGQACIAFTGSAEPHPWKFSDRHGAVAMHHPSVRFCTNDGEQLRAAALAGMGIAQVPAWLVGPELGSGKLKAVLQAFATEQVGISALYITKRNMAAKVRVFIDFLSETLARDLSPQPPQAM